VSLPRDVYVHVWLVNPSGSDIEGHVSQGHGYRKTCISFSKPGGRGFSDFIETVDLQDEDESFMRNGHITIRANLTLK
jgi:hypothetical protein